VQEGIVAEMVTVQGGGTTEENIRYSKCGNCNWVVTNRVLVMDTPHGTAVRYNTYGRTDEQYVEQVTSYHRANNTVPREW